MSDLVDKDPVATLNMDFSAHSTSTSAWTVVTAATTQPCNAVEIFNGGGSLLLLATGATGSEVAIPYTIPPGGFSVLIAIGIAKGVQLQVKAVDTTSDSGYLSINFFG